MANGDKKYQLNIFVGDQSFIFRADNSEDVKLFMGTESINAEAMAEYIQKLDHKLSKQPTKVIKELTTPANCPHSNTKVIEGDSQYGHWEGLKCLDCGAANFKKKSKDGGRYWGGWKVKGQEQPKQPPKPVISEEVPW